jgi:hypothetical protein
MADQRVRSLDQRACQHGRERNAEVDDGEIEKRETAEGPGM